MLFDEASTLTPKTLLICPTVIFNLPYPLNTFFATFGDYWLLKTLHNVAAGLLGRDGKFTRKLNEKEAMDLFATSAGPGVAQLEDGKLAYPEAVNKRIDDHGMSEKIRKSLCGARGVFWSHCTLSNADILQMNIADSPPPLGIYREDLLMGTWEKSLETVVALSEVPVSASRHNSGSSGAGLFDDGPPGAVKAPTTIVYGKHDLGFDKRLALEGIADYLGKGSQVVLVEGAGHWVPVEEFGSQVLEKVVQWAMGDEIAPLRASVAVFGDKTKMLVEK
jgi:hypothetical protein